MIEISAGAKDDSALKRIAARNERVGVHLLLTRDPSQLSMEGGGVVASVFAAGRVIRFETWCSSL